MFLRANKPCLTSIVATSIVSLFPALSQAIVTSTSGGVSVNDLLGADVFYDQGITGQGAVMANVEAGHIWSGHESLSHVSEFSHSEEAFGTTTEDLFDRHATWVGAMMGGRPVAEASIDERQRGIAFGADLKSGALAAQWNGDALSTSWSPRGRSGGEPYVHYFGNADVINSSLNTSPNTNDGLPNDGRGGADISFDGLIASSMTTAVVSAGNYGPGPGIMTSPASAYNVIAVGALTYDSLGGFQTIADFSSRGPLDYGDPVNGLVTNVRAAVDITAPGDQLTGAYYGGPTGGNNPTLPGSPAGRSGGPDAYSNGLSGTSFAAPITAGAATLLKSASYNDPFLASNPASRDTRVVKAVLLNSADKVPDWDNGQQVNGEGAVVTAQGLDYTYGAGALNIGASYAQFLGGHTQDVAGEAGAVEAGEVDAVGWDFGDVALDSVNSYLIDDKLVGGSDFTATLVWYRDRTFIDEVPADNGQADLNLRLVEAATGNVVAESSSRYNVVEHFHFSIPETTEYLLEVSFDGALFGDFESEQYGLAWSGSAAPFMPGDFTNDGSVNGADLLAWQRGESPNPLSAADLAEWQSSYDDHGSLQGVQGIVPEPNTLLLAVLFAVAGVPGAGRAFCSGC